MADRIGMAMFPPPPRPADFAEPAASVGPGESAADAPVEVAGLAGRRLHFVGIGGCGMSGLARMAAARGAVCSGSDRRRSSVTDELEAAGIPVALEQTAAALPEGQENSAGGAEGEGSGAAGLDEVVISAAIKPNHPEVVEARRRGVAVTKYARMLGRLMARQVGVAVAGTHGKSTTTSLLAHILIRAELDPSFIIGANCAQIGGGWRVGGDSRDQASEGSRDRGKNHGSDAPPHSAPGSLAPPAPGPLLLAEACEYDRSFHQLWPTHAVILNVEADHLDLYASLDEIVEAFGVFARRVPDAGAGGSLLINHEMAARLAITAGLGCTVQTIGFAPQADWQVQVAEGDPARCVSLHHDGERVARWRAPMPGEHMAYNAAAAAVTAHRLGAPWGTIAGAIESFGGLDRRMQVVGDVGGRGRGAQGPRGQVNHRGDGASPHSAPGPLGHWAPSAALVIDDYGHHPTEIDTTLRALRRHYRPRRLICVFQPHQHSRTRFLMAQFATSFAAADRVIVPDIYFVRDSQQERQAVTAADLVAAIEAGGSHARHIAELDAIIAHLRDQLRPGDLLVTMGAGDVWKVAHALVKGQESV